MFTVGDFYLYRNRLGQARYVGVVIQKKPVNPSQKEEARMLLLTGFQDDIFKATFHPTTEPVEEQDRFIHYIKRMRTSNSAEDFVKRDFAHVSQGSGEAVPACGRLHMKHCTPIRDLVTLEQALQEFLPMSEYQHASVIRFFKSIQMDFQSTQPPNLSL